MKPTRMKRCTLVGIFILCEVCSQRIILDKGMENEQRAISVSRQPIIYQHVSKEAKLLFVVSVKVLESSCVHVEATHSPLATKTRADNAHLLNVVAWSVEQFWVNVGRDWVFFSSNAARYISCFMFLTKCFDMPLAGLMLMFVSLILMEYIFGRRRIFFCCMWPPVSSLKQQSFALFTTLYRGWVGG